VAFSCASRANSPKDEKETCRSHCGNDDVCPTATTASVIEVQPGHAFIAPPGTEVRHVEATTTSASAFNDPEFHRLAFQLARGYSDDSRDSVADWCELARYVDSRAPASSRDAVLMAPCEGGEILPDSCSDCRREGTPCAIADLVQQGVSHVSNAGEDTERDAAPIERFTLYHDHGRANMMGDDEGEYVLYSDHIAAIAASAKEKK
jgi:hypothetical protein